MPATRQQAVLQASFHGNVLGSLRQLRIARWPCLLVTTRPTIIRPPPGRALPAHTAERPTPAAIVLAKGQNLAESLGEGRTYGQPSRHHTIESSH